MEAVLDEVESLEAILMDDVKITRNAESGFPELIETTVFPTVGEDTDRQYICVTLQVLPSVGYPDISPVFKLQKPRGLDDIRMAEINRAIVAKLAESIGYPVVFDLIDVIREHLSGSNLPSGQCVVCLYGFQEGDEFTKTECYHYLHSYCLARHLIASRRNFNEEQDKLPAWQRKQSKPFEAVCPVCREPIKDDCDHLRTAMPPAELEMAPEFQLTDELKDLQAKMANLYFHQKTQGGIIDVGAEESNVISIEPEEQSSNDRKATDEIDGPADFAPEPQSVSVHQTHAQSIRQPNRSNHQQRNANRNSQSGPNAQRYSAAPAAAEDDNANTSSNSNPNRRHYNRSGRRHHNYGHRRHHYHQQQQQQQQAGQANDQSSCSSKSR